MLRRAPQPRRHLRQALAFAVLLSTPALASAQSTSPSSPASTPYEQRGFVQIGGGAQSGSHTLSSTATFDIYGEPGTIVGAQEYGGGAIWNIGGGMRVWRNLVPQGAWIDQTQVTANSGTIGRWIGRGRFTN